MFFKRWPFTQSPSAPTVQNNTMNTNTENTGIKRKASTINITGSRENPERLTTNKIAQRLKTKVKIEDENDNSAKGAKRAKGAKGVQEAAKSAKDAKGAQAAKSANGAKGAQAAKSAKGAKGAQAAKSAKGAKGAQAAKSTTKGQQVNNQAKRVQAFKESAHLRTVHKENRRRAAEKAKADGVAAKTQQQEKQQADVEPLQEEEQQAVVEPLQDEEQHADVAPLQEEEQQADLELRQDEEQQADLEWGRHDQDSSEMGHYFDPLVGTVGVEIQNNEYRQEVLSAPPAMVFATEDSLKANELDRTDQLEPLDRDQLEQLQQLAPLDQGQEDDEEQRAQREELVMQDLDEDLEQAEDLEEDNLHRPTLSSCLACAVSFVWLAFTPAMKSSNNGLTDTGFDVMGCHSGFIGFHVIGCHFRVHCFPRHRMPIRSRDEGAQWRTISAGHEETNICQDSVIYKA